MLPMSRFIAACRGEPVDCTPVWLMRQAGRYLPEYREVRKETSFLGLCKTPDLACEVTLQPLRRFELDAGIIFSDILVPVEAMGMELRFDDGAGPRLPDPIRAPADVDKIFEPDPVETMGFVMDAIRLFCKARPQTPLIGFAGAPFTLASYMIEGRGSRNYEHCKRFMFEHPKAWRKLGEKLARTVANHLLAQAEAGCQALQLFDSWAGHLSPDDYKTFALPYTLEIIDRIKKAGVPIILFAKGVHGCWDELSHSGADVLGIDWTVPLDQVREVTGNRVVLQGNLDPLALIAPAERIERQVQRIVNEAQGCKGHIFNLGHGILKFTPPESVGVLVEAVHRHGANRVPESLR